MVGDTRGVVKTRRRRIQRCRRCPSFCKECCCDNSIGAIVVVAVLIATGFLLAISAGFQARDRWLWPFLNSLCAITPLIPLFMCGGIEHICHLLDSSIDAGERFSDERDGEIAMFGWFLIGATLVIAFTSPLLLVQLGVVTQKVVWLSAFGSWCFTASLILGGAFVVHFHLPSGGGGRASGSNDDGDGDVEMDER